MRPADEASAFAQTAGHVTPCTPKVYGCQAAVFATADTLVLDKRGESQPNSPKLGPSLAHDRRALPTEIARLKRQAFSSSHRAKASTTQESRVFFYRRKDAAINALLNLGWAFVDEVDWWQDDPLIDVWFVGGGWLHIPMSCVDLQAFREVRAQLNGSAQPDRARQRPESRTGQEDKPSTGKLGVPSELKLTLGWIDSLLAEDNEVASAAHENEEFSAELIEIHRSVELGMFKQADIMLVTILEKFALTQAIAFERRLGLPCLTKSST